MGERSTVYSPLSSVPVGGPRRPGRRGKERPEPSGSLPWDTSCTALGPRRSPHLNGSLPRLPAEVYAAGDIRHPRPARPAPPRSVLARLGRGARALWALAVRSGCARPTGAGGQFARPLARDAGLARSSPLLLCGRREGPVWRRWQNARIGRRRDEV